jgi:hypothetical protein
MLRKLPMCFLAMSMAQAIQLQNGESEFEQIFQKSLSRPACTSVEGSCKTDTAAAPNLDVRTVFNLPAGSQVNDVDGGPPGPHGPPYPIAINAQVSSRPACTSEEGSCKTGTAADPAIDTRHVFNLPAGSVVNDVDGGPPGPTSPLPININLQLDAESRPACTSFECKTGTAAFQFDNEKAGKHPMDYFVPNFGEDKEMIAQAQHLKEAEAKYGKWDLKESKEIKRDYTVPNFGVDHDIADSLASETSTSAQLGINWTPTQDANGVWLVPQPIDNKSYSYKV